MLPSTRILFVEDSDDDFQLVLNALKRGGCDPEYVRVDSADGMRAALGKQPWDLILSDYSLPSFSGMGALSVLQESKLEIPLIIVSGTIGEETAVEALKAGAKDYLLKSRLTRLVPAVERVLRDSKEWNERQSIRQVLAETEEQLRQSQKMEALGRLAGGVSHDFNNILAVIGLHCESALEHLPDDAHAREAVEQIFKAQQRAAALTRQLLLFSRRQVPELGPIDVNAVVTDMTHMITRLIGEDIQLKIDLRQALRLTKSDVGQIGQILMNLIVNARDAMPQGGTLTIRTENADLGSTPALSHWEAKPGPHALLVVEDTGCGMSAEVLSRIFEPFFTTKGKGKGTGLGLSTVFGIVQQGQGFVSVESEIGRGTAFRVYLPECGDVAVVRPGAGLVVGALEGSESVLLVEDDEDLRRVLAAALRKRGYSVTEAGNGMAALSALGESDRAPDLIITDVVMPEMGGVELVQRLGLQFKALKVLFLSGYTEEKLLQHGVTGTEAYFLDKPFTSKVLLIKVRTILSPPPGAGGA